MRLLSPPTFKREASKHRNQLTYQSHFFLFSQCLKTSFTAVGIYFGAIAANIISLRTKTTSSTLVTKDRAIY